MARNLYVIFKKVKEYRFWSEFWIHGIRNDSNEKINTKDSYEFVFGVFKIFENFS